MNSLMVSEETFHQELEQIQNIIERQASNSFKIKGWAVTLIVVVLLFRSKDIHLAVAYIPLIGFWYLDAYYLRQERKFRALYDWVRQNRENTDENLFDMDTSRVDDDVKPVRELMRRKSVLVFYGTITSLLIIYSAIVLANGTGVIYG